MPEKVSKASVNYSLGGDHCEVCTHFYNENEAAETGECELVDGVIRSDFWCKLFKRRKHGTNLMSAARLKSVR